MITVKRNVTFVRRPDKSQAILVSDGHTNTPVPPDRVPRISRLMALAIHFDRLVREGNVADLSELARLAHVTQPRMTQIMNLNHLAPDIQDELLHLAAIAMGRERIHERMLRSIAGETSWASQRARWKACKTASRIASGP